MAKKQEAVDDLLDALVWMRRKAKRHAAVDDLIDALVKMRRKAKKKVAKGKTVKKKVKKRQRSKGWRLSAKDDSALVNISSVQCKRLKECDVSVSKSWLCTGLFTGIGDGRSILGGIVEKCFLEVNA
jgi:ClpP class serine protease